MNYILPIVTLVALGFIIKNMATETQLNDALASLESNLTTEIDQIKAELVKQGIPDSAIERLTALSDRVKGIIADTATPPVEGEIPA